MTFEKIQSQAISEWEALNDSDKPHILIRIATCSQKAGALAVLEAIKSALAKNHIEAIITQVGCIGLCYAEPLVDIIKPNHPLDNITGSKGQPQDIDLLTELTETMGLGTLCPLCGNTTSPTRSVRQYFRDELEAHIKEHRCPAGVCQAAGGAAES